MRLFLLLLRLYLVISGAIFFMVGVLHLFRLVNQWPIVVGTSAIPQVLSYIGFPVSTGYALWALWLLRKSFDRSFVSLADSQGTDRLRSEATR